MNISKTRQKTNERYSAVLPGNAGSGAVLKKMKEESVMSIVNLGSKNNPTINEVLEVTKDFEKKNKGKRKKKKKSKSYDNFFMIKHGPRTRVRNKQALKEDTLSSLGIRAVGEKSKGISQAISVKKFSDHNDKAIERIFLKKIGEKINLLANVNSNSSNSNELVDDDLRFLSALKKDFKDKENVKEKEKEKIKGASNKSSFARNSSGKEQGYGTTTSSKKPSISQNANASKSEVKFIPGSAGASGTPVFIKISKVKTLVPQSKVNDKSIFKKLILDDEPPAVSGSSTIPAKSKITTNNKLPVKKPFEAVFNSKLLNFNSNVPMHSKIKPKVSKHPRNQQESLDLDKDLLDTSQFSTSTNNRTILDTELVINDERAINKLKINTYNKAIGGDGASSTSRVMEESARCYENKVSIGSNILAKKLKQQPTLVKSNLNNTVAEIERVSSNFPSLKDEESKINTIKKTPNLLFHQKNSSVNLKPTGDLNDLLGFDEDKEIEEGIGNHLTLKHGKSTLDVNKLGIGLGGQLKSKDNILLDGGLNSTTKSHNTSNNTPINHLISQINATPVPSIQRVQSKNTLSPSFNLIINVNEKTKVPKPTPSPLSSINPTKHLLFAQKETKENFNFKIIQNNILKSKHGLNFAVVGGSTSSTGLGAVPAITPSSKQRIITDDDVYLPESGSDVNSAGNLDSDTEEEIMNFDFHQDSVAEVPIFQSKKLEILDIATSSVNVMKNSLSALFKLKSEIKKAILAYLDGKSIFHLSMTSKFMNKDTSSLKTRYIMNLVLTNGSITLRKRIWRRIYGFSQLNSKNLTKTYSELLYKTSNYEPIIKKDLLRTVPEDPSFKSGNVNNKKLFNVLKAYSLYNPKIGYAQGLNFIVAYIMLMHLYKSEEDIFFVLDCFINKFDIHKLIGVENTNLSPKLKEIGDLLKVYAPDLEAFFAENYLDQEYFTTQWVITIFASFVKANLLFKIWELFILFGWNFLKYFVVSIMLTFKQNILQIDPNNLSSYLKVLLKSDAFENDFREIVSTAFDYMNNIDRVYIRNYKSTNRS